MDNHTKDAPDRMLYIDDRIIHGTAVYLGSLFRLFITILVSQVALYAARM